MNWKYWHLLCLQLFICLNICQCNTQEEEQEDLIEQEKLKDVEQEKELVVAAIYKVAL